MIKLHTYKIQYRITKNIDYPSYIFVKAYGENEAIRRFKSIRPNRIFVSITLMK